MDELNADRCRGQQDVSFAQMKAEGAGAGGDRGQKDPSGAITMLLGLRGAGRGNRFQYRQFMLMSLKPDAQCARRTAIRYR